MIEVPGLTLPDLDVVHVAGDWHGHTSWAIRALRALADDGCQVLLHVGDFGFFPNLPFGPTFLAAVEREAARHGITVLVTAGNHDNHEAIDRLVAAAGPGPAQLSAHVWVLPRGHRFALGGRSFVSLGGAASIDFEARTEGIDWWREEVVTEADVAAATAGGRADVLITHEAPLEAINEIILSRAGMGKLRHPKHISDYSNASAVLVQEAREVIDPTLHFHGHWHIPGSQRFEGSREVVSMGMNGQRQNLARVTLETLSWQALETSALDALIGRTR